MGWQPETQPKGKPPVEKTKGAETMQKRLIDADALKEVIDCGHLRNPCEVCFSELDVVNLIDAQPTIDAEPQWIPCSERMPNDDKDYLVTDGESMAVGYYRTDAKAWDNVNFGWLEHRGETCGLKTVIAWMPLPKPYEGDKE